MLVIDVKTIYGYAGLNYTENPSGEFLGSTIIDSVYSCLCDLGFNPTCGRYVTVPEYVKHYLLLHIQKSMMGVPSNTTISLSKVDNFVYVAIGN